MHLIKLIKQRASVRKYKKKEVSKNKIEKILEGGIWGPAIHHFQPWKFVVVKNRSLINKISKLVAQKLKAIRIPNFIASPTISTLNNANLYICVYNTKVFSKTMKKYNKKIFKNFELAEISAISACIQNMILIIEDLKLGSCWLDMPLFCRRGINKLLKQKGDLIAILTIGYPQVKGIRSVRIKKQTVFHT